ncbi:MAG: hydantoinase/oxoprolinase family protein, partial [Alphaproteobacteria bacterium]
DEPWEVEALRITVSAAPAYAPDRLPTVVAGDEARPTSTSPCVFEGHGALATPRFARADLAVDQRIAGPAVIEDEWSTVVVDPGATAWADSGGHLHIDAGVPA